MTVYRPGTLETDPKKQNMALQQHATAIDTNTTNVATNTSAITALQTPNYGLVNGSGALGVSLSKITASLGSNVALNNTANYFDGPSVAQGSTGTWLACGTVTLGDTGSATVFSVKLWDGTTVIASSRATATATGQNMTVSLSGFITSPAGNIRISVKDESATTGLILFNASGNSKDSTISAIRIA